MLPSESVTNAIHSSVPAGPRASSSWLKMTCGSDSTVTPRSTQRSIVSPHVVDPQVDQGRRGNPVEQQPGRADLEEQQPGRVEEAGRLRLEQPGVELAGPVEVDRALGHLEHVHGDSFW